MTLSFYIARRFLVMFALVFFGFFGVLYLIDLIEEVRRLDGGQTFGRAASLALLHTPGSVYRILPLIMILTAIGLFLQLARTSELVAIRAAGRSALRTLAAPVISALVLGAVAVAVLDPLAAATTKRYQDLSAGVGASAASFSGDGLWLRQGDRDGQWVIHADRASPDGGAVFDVTFLSFGKSGGPRSRIDARRADLQHGTWIATDAKEWRFDDQSNPEAGAIVRDRIEISTSLTADEIRNSFGAPTTISFWDLPAFIAELDRAGFSSRAYSVWLHMELALPLLLAAMVLVGAGFTMRHARFGHTGTMVLVALVSGIAIFFVRNFAQVLGESGQIPIFLAAWSPPIAALLLSVSLLLHLEDG